MAVKIMNETIVKAAGKPASPTAKALSVGPVPTKSEAPSSGAPLATQPIVKPASPVRTRAASKPTPRAVPVIETVPVSEAIQEPQVLAVPAPAALPSGEASPSVSPVATTVTNPGPMSPIAKVPSIMKNAEQFVAFSQANVEAFMKSSQIWTAGLQGLSKQMAANAQLALDETVSTLKAMTSVKSVKEAIELQTSLARSTVEKAVAGTTQITDASMKLAEETMAPITERMQAAAQTFSIAA